MTRYIPKDKLKEIRSLSAIDYLKNYHPDLLIKNGRDVYKRQIPASLKQIMLDNISLMML